MLGNIVKGTLWELVKTPQVEVVAKLYLNANPVKQFRQEEFITVSHKQGAEHQGKSVS